MSLVKGISDLSKGRSEFFDLKHSGDAECKIQADVVNAILKNFAKNFAVRSHSSNHHALFPCHVRHGGFVQWRIERSETSLAVTYCAGRPDNQRFFSRRCGIRMTGNAGASLNHPEFHPSCFADHVLVPRRVPNKLDVGFINAVDG
jgi:hypothetical protein